MTPATIINAAMLGTARQPLKIDGPLAAGIDSAAPDVALKLLALAGQALRFERPASPPAFEEVVPLNDPRTMIGPDARKQLLRMVSGKGASDNDAVARAAAKAMAVYRLRPHPFDLPRMPGFVRKFADDLGTTAMAHAARSGEDGTEAGYFDGDAIDESNWTLATPARKGMFIADCRSRDAAAARALVEAQLPLEKADARMRIVAALGSGLGPGDQAVLESLANDRAPKVKEIASRLLARLPGTPQAETKARDIASRIKVGKAGLLRRRTVLKLQLPADVKNAFRTYDWLAETFSGLGIASLAAELSLSEQELIEAATDDRDLSNGLGFSACAERRFDMLREIASKAETDYWTAFLNQGLDSFGLVNTEDKQSWASAVLRFKSWESLGHVGLLERLHEILDGPLSEATAQALLGSSCWKTASAEAVSAAAALIPPSLASQLQQRLASLPPENAARAQSLARFYATVAGQKEA